MRRLAFLSGATLGILAGCAVSAQGAEFPSKFPVKAYPVSDAGWYGWADGSYESVGLPSYDLGWRRVTFTPTTDRGPLQTYNPRATGYGLSGAIGYVLPHGTFAFGTRGRIEFGGKFVHANAADAASDSAAGGIALQYISGIIPTVVPGLALQTCATCAVSSTLSSKYSAWQLHAKAASDIKIHNLTLTPSVGVFGGGAQNTQSLSQLMSRPGVSYSYTANSSVRWMDWGVRTGLDAAVDLTEWLSIGVGGTVAWAHRDVSMSADDAAVFPGAIGAYLSGSSVAANTTRSSFLAGAETRLTIRNRSNIKTTLFAGLNYDSHVPGIAAPSFSNPFPVGVQQTPASLKFDRETSYYAGARVAVQFSP